MKGYTNLEQSKKLAEILPFESADMYWWATSKRYYIEAMDDGDFNEREGHVRAWSLAALLELMPKKIKYDGGIVYPEFHIWNNSFEYNNNADYVLHITNSYDNPIDACYEMILKLHELKML